MWNVIHDKGWRRKTFKDWTNDFEKNIWRYTKPIKRGIWEEKEIRHRNTIQLKSLLMSFSMFVNKPNIQSFLKSKRINWVMTCMASEERFNK